MRHFQEIAKLRAGRLLWAKLMKQFDPKNKKSLSLRTHCQTSGWSLTEQDPFNNVARTTIEAAAAIFGGTQSLHTNALDEAIGLPTDFSARIARETQLFLMEETKIIKTVDPWAGSHYVEQLTDDLVHRAWELIQEVEALGGMTKAIEAGIPKMRIEEAAARKQARIDNGEETILGVNKYPLESEDDLHILEVDNNEVRRQQIERLNLLKKNRDAKIVEAALNRLTRAAKHKMASLKTNGANRQGGATENLLALAVEAARARATLGEISSALEGAFGRHEANIQSITGVYSKEIKNDVAFKKALALADRFAEKEGRRPRILDRKNGTGRS